MQKQLTAVVKSTKTTSGTRFVSTFTTEFVTLVCCSISLCGNFYTQQLMGMMMQWATHIKVSFPFKMKITFLVLCNLNNLFS